jgi:hypothetical protein
VILEFFICRIVSIRIVTIEHSINCHGRQETTATVNLSMTFCRFIDTSEYDDRRRFASLNNKNVRRESSNVTPLKSVLHTHDRRKNAFNERNEHDAIFPTHSLVFFFMKTRRKKEKLERRQC